MNVVDSSGWLEYFTGGRNASHFATPLKDSDSLIVPAVSIYEVFKVLLREAGEDAALAQYVGTILQAFEEAESGLVADRHLETRERSIAASLEHAEAAYRIARDQYNSGLVGVVTLLITQRQLLQRRSDHLSAKRERLTNRVDVHMALGGGIESPSMHAKGSSS